MMPSLARLACLALAVAGAAALPMSARKKHTLAETFKSIESDIAALERASASRRAAPVGLERAGGKEEVNEEVKEEKSLDKMIESIKGLDKRFAAKLETIAPKIKELGAQSEVVQLIGLLQKKDEDLAKDRGMLNELLSAVDKQRRDFQRNKEAQIKRAVDEERARTEDMVKSLEELLKRKTQVDDGAVIRPDDDSDTSEMKNAAEKRRIADEERRIADEATISDAEAQIRRQKELLEQVKNLQTLGETRNMALRAIQRSEEAISASQETEKWKRAVSIDELIVHTMLEDAPGLRWDPIRPPVGSDCTLHERYPKLVEALVAKEAHRWNLYRDFTHKEKFTQKEWEDLGITDLKADDCIYLENDKVFIHNSYSYSKYFYAGPCDENSVGCEVRGIKVFAAEEGDLDNAREATLAALPDTTTDEEKAKAKAEFDQYHEILFGENKGGYRFDTENGGKEYIVTKYFKPHVGHRAKALNCELNPSFPGCQSGLQWVAIKTEPTSGRGRNLGVDEATGTTLYPQLVTALEAKNPDWIGKKEKEPFTQEEWDALGITDLTPDDWIKLTTDDSTYTAHSWQGYDLGQRDDSPIGGNPIYEHTKFFKPYSSDRDDSSLQIPSFKDALTKPYAENGKWTLSGRYLFEDGTEKSTEYEWGQGLTDNEVNELDKAELAKRQKALRKHPSKWMTLEKKKKHRCRLGGTFEMYKEDLYEKDFYPELIKWKNTGNIAFEQKEFGPSIPKWKGIPSEKPPGPCLIQSNWKISGISINDERVARLCTFYSIDCSA